MRSCDSIRVMIVDDHQTVRRGLSVFLRIMEGIQVVGEAADGLQAVALSHTVRPDVILMDILMPLMDGVTATATIHHALPQVRILALTGFEDEGLAQAILAAGAVGTVSKDVSPQQLAQAIWQVGCIC